MQEGRLGEIDHSGHPGVRAQSVIFHIAKDPPQEGARDGRGRFSQGVGGPTAVPHDDQELSEELDRRRFSGGAGRGGFLEPPN